jgi:hypothetical protein
MSATNDNTSSSYQEYVKRDEEKAARFRAKMATVGITPGQFVLELCNCEAMFFGLAETRDDYYGLSASEIVDLQCDIVEFNATHAFHFIFQLYRTADKSIRYKILCESEAQMSVKELLETIALFRPYMFGVFSDFIAHLVDDFPRNREGEPVGRLLDWP